MACIHAAQAIHGGAVINTVLRQSHGMQHDDAEAVARLTGQIGALLRQGTRRQGRQGGAAQQHRQGPLAQAGQLSQQGGLARAVAPEYRPALTAPHLQR
jgi:hypothetical protein